MDSTRPRSPALLLLLLVLVSGPLGLWLLQAEGPRPIELNVMSFNIRNGHGKDGDDRWERRQDLVAGVIRGEAPDVLALQEAYRFQLDFLLGQLPGYAAVGDGRDGGMNGEHCSILFRSDRFAATANGTFWLSDTPSTPSASWGNRYRRICTWVQLRDRETGRTLSVYNTHLDHESQAARERGIELILQHIASRAVADPVVLCGDLNAGEDNPVIAFLKGDAPLAGPTPRPLVDSWRVLHPDEADCGTVSRFRGSREPYKIDYILVPCDAGVLAAGILRTHREGRYPSDHYPVTAVLRLR